MWSVSVGLLAATMTALEPLQWYSAGTMLSESLDTLLLMLVVADWLHHVRPREAQTAVAVPVGNRDQPPPWFDR